MKKETNVDKLMDKIKGKPRKKPAQTICALRHQEEAARKARLKLERETEKAAKAAHKKIDADDEPGFKFDKHVFKPGEYVSVREHDGKMRTFRVVSVTDLD